MLWIPAAPFHRKALISYASGFRGAANKMVKTWSHCIIYESTYEILLLLSRPDEIGPLPFIYAVMPRR